MLTRTNCDCVCKPSNEEESKSAKGEFDLKSNPLGILIGVQHLGMGIYMAVQ